MTQTSSRNPCRWYWPLLLTGLYFLYVWLRIDPGLLFEATPRFPAFLWGAEFAAPFFGYAGGPLEYLGALLSQYLYYSWAGALIITALAAMLCLSTDYLLRTLSGGASSWLALAPATLVLLIYSQLGHHMADIAGLSLAVAGAALYAALLTRALPWRVAGFLGLSLVLYYALGGVYLPFVILCGILEMSVGAGRLPGLLYLLTGEALPQLVGVYLLDMSLARAFARNTPFDSTFFPLGRLTLLGLWLVVIIAAVATARARAEQTATSGPARPRRKWLQDRPRVRLLLIALLLVVPPLATYRGVAGLLLRANRALARHDYRGAVALMERARPKEPPGELVFTANYALYRTGALHDQMFAHAQSPEGLVLGMVCGPGLRPNSIRRARLYNPFECGQFFLELGLPNQAEWVLSEALESYGPHARTLALLSVVNLVKERPEAAAQFLRVLSRHPIRGGWARRQLERVTEDPGQLQNEQVQLLRRMRFTQDSRAVDINLEQQCLALLRHNRHNLMAFEYLMAYYLLNRDLDKFTACVERIGDFEYQELPRHWQEALALNEARTGKPVGLGGYLIGASYHHRFAEFSNLIRPLQESGDALQARRLAAPAFGDTYYYYYIFGVSGVGQR